MRVVQIFAATALAAGALYTYTRNSIVSQPISLTGSTQKTIIPLVDMSASADQCAAIIRDAAVIHGFFYLKNHGINPLLLRQVFTKSKEFFELPVEEKMKTKVNDKFRGFDPKTKDVNTDWQSVPEMKVKKKESFFIGREISPDNPECSLPLSGLNQWPNELSCPGFRDIMSRYYFALWELGLKVARLIALSLKIPETFFDDNKFFENPSNLLRLLHYDGIVSGNVPAAFPHTDYGMFTLLYTDENPGLQISLKQNEWVKIEQIPETFIVNIGDMLQNWTDGLYKSTIHRVVLEKPIDRYSVAYFFEPNQKAVIKPLNGGKGEGVQYGAHLLKKHEEAQQQYDQAKPKNY